MTVMLGIFETSICLYVGKNMHVRTCETSDMSLQKVSRYSAAPWHPVLRDSCLFPFFEAFISFLFRPSGHPYNPTATLSLHSTNTYVCLM